MKKASKVLLAVALMFAFAGFITAHAEDEDRTITIFHTNDIHARLHQQANVGGWNPPIRMGVDFVAGVLAANENAIWVDAGDTIHGLPFVLPGRGQVAVQMLNAAGLSIMVPGNHDFNFGLDRLLELSEYAQFDVIAANVFWRDEAGAPTEDLVFEPYIITEIGGITVGFFGLATPVTPARTLPANVADIYFGSTIDAASLAVYTLRTQHNVDVVVAIAHLGTDDYYTSIEVIEAVDGINLFVDGHSHDRAGELVGDTWLVQAYEHGLYLGRADITVSASGEVTIAVELLDIEYVHTNYEADQSVSTLIEELLAEVDAMLEEVVGYSPVALQGARAYVRTQEAQVGNLVADAFVWASGADFAVVNGGSITSSLPAGDITTNTLLSVLPNPNYIVVVEVTRQILWDIVEHAVSGWPADVGRFPQISGFSFEFDGYAEPGSRVTSLTIGGEYDTVFTLAINDFMSTGGDGFAMLAELPRVAHAGMLAEVFLAFIESDGVSLESYLYLDGRMLQVGAPPEEVPEEPPVEEPPLEEPPVEEPPVEEPPVEEPSVEETPVEVLPAGTATVTAYYLNVRSRAGVSAPAINFLRRGSVVTVLDSMEVAPGHTWYRVSYNGIAGWVYSRFIQHS